MKEVILFSINSIDARRSGFDIPASIQMASDYSERVDPRRFYAAIKSPDSLVLKGSRPESKLIERFADFLKSAGRANLLAEDGGIAQLVERLVRNEKARGSNPLTSNFQTQCSS